MNPQNTHGYFTLPAYVDRPIFYDVQVLSSGRSFCTRIVTARQPVQACSFPFDAVECGKKLGNVCFMSMCSFRKDETSSTKHSIKADFKPRYDKVLKQDPSEHGPAPKVDTPWYVRSTDFCMVCHAPKDDKTDKIQVDGSDEFSSTPLRERLPRP